MHDSKWKSKAEEAERSTQQIARTLAMAVVAAGGEIKIGHELLAQGQVIRLSTDVDDADQSMVLRAEIEK